MKLNEIAQPQVDLHSPHPLKYSVALWGEQPRTEEEIAALIQRECGTMVHAYSTIGATLFRGIASKDLAVSAKIRMDRRPVEMPMVAHNALADIFSEVGLDANRSNSIFCTVDRSIADAWGDVYIVFVRDGWSATVFDRVKKGYVFSELIDAAEELGDGFRLSPAEKAGRIASLKMAVIALKPRNITSAAELQDVLVDEYQDVLVTGSSYIALRNGTSSTYRILELLGIGQ